MPSYCDTTPEVNSVPSPIDMRLFKPYFEIIDGESSFTVYIKVDSNCYFVESSGAGYPSGGPCGDPGDYQCQIFINKQANCSNSEEAVLQHVLNYAEDPNGEKINIYVVDKSKGGTAGQSKGVKKVSH